MFAARVFPKNKIDFVQAHAFQAQVIVAEYGLVAGALANKNRHPGPQQFHDGRG